MSLTRSTSGPGGLNLTTGASPSIFGSTPVSTSSPGVFGNATTTPATGGLFGSVAAPAPATTATGGLFGGAAKPATGGLFGSSATTNATPASGGLFGSASSAAAPPASGGLFGSAATTANPAQGGGLFGGTNTATTATPTSSSLFGGALGASAAPKPAAASGGLFGASKPAGGMFSTQSSFGGTSKDNSSGSMFAPNQSQQQPQQSQQFGGMMGGGLQLGQSTQQQNVVPGVKIDMSNIRPTTRFNDLNEQLQKDIEAMDNVIFACQQQSNGITSLLPGAGEKIAYLPDSVEFLSRKRIGVESAMESDAESLDLVGKLFEQDLHNATLSFRAVDVLNLPQQYHTPRHFLGNNNTNEAETGDIVSFFSQAADDMSGRLATYQQRIAEIEMHLRGVEAATIEQARALNNGSGANVGDEIREVALVLREFESGILAVAGSVGAAREGVQKLQLGGFEQIGQTSQRFNGNGKRTGIY